MTIVLTSIFVDDQDKALAFYRDVLGFALGRDIPLDDTCGNLIQIMQIT